MNEDLEKRREVAMQTIRPAVYKKLEELMRQASEEFEDEIIEALVDAGIDAPLGSGNIQEIDEAISLVRKCWDDAAKYFHGSEHGPVWVLVSWDPENSRSNGLEVEVFGDRPKTWQGPDWPDWFRVFEGNIDGGDTVRGDARGVAFG